jgi:hypothetical protein
MANPLLDEQIDRLAGLADRGDDAGVRRLLQEIVPEYRAVAMPGLEE